MPPPLILCVDDNEEGLILRKMVVESAGYSVLIAGSGAKGIELFADNPIDGVVLDYCMPGMDGGEVAAEMRRFKPDVPILLLSGFVNDIPARVLNQVDVFIPKGSATSSLLQELRSRVPVAGPDQRKPPQRDELFAQAHKILATSRDVLKRNRDHADRALRHLESSRTKRKE